MCSLTQIGYSLAPFLKSSCSERARLWIAEMAGSSEELSIKPSGLLLNHGTCQQAVDDVNLLRSELESGELNSYSVTAHGL